MDISYDRLKSIVAVFYMQPAKTPHNARYNSKTLMEVCELAKDEKIV